MSGRQEEARRRVGRMLTLSAVAMFVVGVVLVATGNALAGWIIAGFGVVDLLLARVLPGRMALQRTVQQQLADVEQRYRTGEMTAEDYQAERARILDDV